MQVSEAALVKIKEVLEDEGKKDTPLRVIALPQPNGAVQYMLTMEQESQSDDITIDEDGVQFIVDVDSAPFLEKATIDFVEDLEKVGFTITNPDHPAPSGCGSGGCGCGGGGGGCGCGGGGCGS
jgi:iron-sulfur cluster assembly accessory protein